MAQTILLFAFLTFFTSQAHCDGNETTLPLTYDTIELLNSDNGVCPTDELQQGTLNFINNNVQDDIQDSAFPSLLTSQGYTCIVNFDMSDPNQQCPNAWNEIATPVRTCARTTPGVTCDSAFFPVNGRIYSRVCGRVRAYQIGSTDAFYGANVGRSDIDQQYVEGISITHSSPRVHIWTLASAYHEQHVGAAQFACPCTNTANAASANYLIPSFVGNDYFCETGADTIAQTGALNFIADDVLWDGKDCGPTSTCCELNNPPWFCKTLPAPTEGDIEVRICADESVANENIAVEQIELYVF